MSQIIIHVLTNAVDAKIYIKCFNMKFHVHSPMLKLSDFNKFVGYENLFALFLAH